MVVHVILCMNDLDDRDWRLSKLTASNLQGPVLLFVGYLIRSQMQEVLNRQQYLKNK